MVFYFIGTYHSKIYADTLEIKYAVFSSLEFTGKIPFKNVYIHPTVLALSGKRMSKSLGTGIDPLELVEKYGADATRLGLIYQTNREQQSFRFDERAVLSSRNFVNKLWNISRFIFMLNNEKKIKDDELVIAVQVNGKVRAEIKVGAEISEEEIKKIVLDNEIIKGWVDGKELKRFIYVKGKLVSLVV